MEFTSFNFEKNILKGVEEAGFEKCTPVQTAVFEYLVGPENGQRPGKLDLTVQSQTGTGKTAAFLLSLYQMMANDKEDTPKRALIIAPTRELALQIREEGELLGSFLPYRYGTIFGGVSYAPQEKIIKDQVEFVIGTPGRIIDLNQSKILDLRAFNYLVIDEADRLFDMGFYPDLQKILRKMPNKTERNTMLFSATLGTKVMNLAWDHMNDPKEIVIEPEQVTVEAISQELYHVSREEKINVLLGLLSRHNPKNAIFFTNTKRMAEELSWRLTINGYNSSFLMGDLPQKKRTRIIKEFKSGQKTFMVATDVAARGLHIDDLEMVINYDLPEDPENYVHRIGRTARAGKEGIAISLCDERFVYGLPAIETFIDQKIDVAALENLYETEDKSAGMRMPHDKAARTAAGKAKSGKPKSERKSTSHHSKKRGNTGKQTEQRKKTGGDSHAHGKDRRQTIKHPGRNATEAERREYYRKKYGEEFSVDSSGKSKENTKPYKRDNKHNQKQPSESAKKPGLFGWLSRIFNRDKK